MPSHEGRDEARDRTVNETLDLIDKLDVDQARSLLRCFAIDEENFDSRALETVATTVHDTCYKTGGDYDALCHFPDIETARLNREYLLEALAASAEAERVAQQLQAEEQAQKKRAQSTQASETIPKVEPSTKNGKKYQQLDGAADESPTPDLGDPEFEKAEIRRLIRDGHVTINHYYVNQDSKGQQQTQPKAPQPQRYLCAQCNNHYFEKENILRKNGDRPCGYHTGQVVYYGDTLDEAWDVYGSYVAGEAWNCCRRRRHDKGCHPAFHRPA